MSKTDRWLGNATVSNSQLREGRLSVGYQAKKPRGRSFATFEELFQYETRDAVFVPPEVDTLDKLKIWCEAADQD